MTLETEDLLQSILASLDRIDHIDPEEIPDIDLYVDQVTTFIGSRLKHTTRNPKEDKILTKTMINNYAKNDLLPPPVKKKYSKEHVLLLIFIYYYKNILSINDIQTILKPVADAYFQKDGDFKLEDVYNEVFALEKAEVDRLKQDVAEKFRVADSTFSDAAQQDQKFLRLFSFICMLSFDVYVKKLIIEKLVDSYRAQSESEEEKRSHKGEKQS